MEIKLWQPKSLPKELLHTAYSFIIRRFKEEWDINRTDISESLIFNRETISLHEGTKIRGWLGVEGNGEFVNACIEKGFMGVKQLNSLIVFYLKITKDVSRLHAFVPIEKTGSAVAFFMAGMKVQEPVEIKKESYINKTIMLVKLVFPIQQELNVSLRQHVHTQLEVIEGIKEKLVQHPLNPTNYED